MPKKVRSLWELVAENKTKQAFDQIAGDLKQTDRGFQGLALSAGVIKTVVAGAVGFLAHQAFASADATAKLALKLNSTTEALSQLDYVAERSGVSNETVANALRDMGKNASLAAAGQGEAKNALQALGISAERFKQLRAEDQLLVMAQALQGVQDPADKSRLAMQVMGEAGGEMIKIMAGGPEPIRQLMRQADSLGLTLDTKTGKAAERVADSLTNLTAHSRAAQIAFVRYLGPSVAAVAEAIGAALPKAIFYAGKGLAWLRAEAVGFAAAAIDRFAYVYDLLSLLPGSLGDTYEAASIRARNLAAGIADLGATYRAEFEGMTFSTEGFKAAVGDGADIAAVYDETLKGLAARQKQEAAAAKDAAAAAKAAAAERAAAEKEAAAAREAIERRIAGIYEATRTPLERYTAQVRELIALRAHGLDKDTFVRAIQQAQEGLENLSAKTEETSEEMSEFGKQAAANLQTHFADFLFDPFAGGLKGMLSGFEATLRRMAAEAAATQLFESLGGEGGVAGVIGGIAAAFGFRQHGGPVAAGMPYWVGEGGRRELFVPDRAGRVVPEGRGLVTVNNNISVAAGPGGTIDRRSLAQLQAAVGEATARALARNR
jgi:chemotaxis protein histidine kinase CheA